MKYNKIILSLLLINFYNFMVCSDESSVDEEIAGIYSHDFLQCSQVLRKDSSPNSVAARPQSPWRGRRSTQYFVKSFELVDCPYELESRHATSYEPELHKRINSRFSQASIDAIRQAQQQKKRARAHYFFNDMKEVAARQQVEKNK